MRGPDGAGELSAAMTRYTHAVSARSDHLSVPDLRAVSRLLEMGSAHASRVLDRVAPAVAGAADAAAGLRAFAPVSQALRDVPATSMTPPHLDLLREGTELQLRMAALAGQALRLPAGAAEADLRRLAVPALEFAQQVPALAGALDLSVREAVAAKLMPDGPRVDEGGADLPARHGGPGRRDRRRLSRLATGEGDDPATPGRAGAPLHAQGRARPRATGT